MTLHNAKGLEYPIVFMIGCEEGVFPHSRALDEGGLEEERRLCYVGITRAERDLYLTSARTRTVFGARNFGAPSRFCQRDPGGADRPREPGAARVRRRSAPGRRRGRRERRADLPAAEQPPPVAYRLGDDVVHAAFGEGVVTGVEPGGIVVIRFSKRSLRAQAGRRSGADLQALMAADVRVERPGPDGRHDQTAGRRQPADPHRAAAGSRAADLPGELTSAVSALGLLVLMFLTKWYGVAGVPDPSPRARRSRPPRTRWHGLTIVRWVMLLTIVAASDRWCCTPPSAHTARKTDTSRVVIGAGIAHRGAADLPGADRAAARPTG